MLEFTDFAVYLKDGPPGAHRATVRVSMKTQEDNCAQVEASVVISAPLETPLGEVHQQAVAQAIEAMEFSLGLLKARPASLITQALWDERRE